MGARQNRLENTTARLRVKKETLRALHGLGDEQLRQVAGGMGSTRGPSQTCLPSCNGC